MSAALYLADPYRAEAPARVVAHTAEGGVILDGTRAVGAAESFWQLSRAALERFSP